jgi:hypothetical protein
MQYNRFSNSKIQAKAIQDAKMIWDAFREDDISNRTATAHFWAQRMDTVN